MDNKLFRTKEKTNQLKQTKATYHAAVDDTRKCPHCGTAVPAHLELCPNCMKPLRSGNCSFCGAPMYSGDMFCAECGNSVAGVKCPRCGTVNHRGFCYKCHEALTENATLELKKAQADPKFRHMQKLALEVELMKQLLLQEDTTDETNAVVSEKASINSDEITLPSFVTNNSESEAQQNTYAEMRAVMQKLSKKEKKQVIKEKVEEINDILASFAPDPDSTPEMQRDYYSARQVKVLVKKTEKVTTGWVCNYCGCFHSCPEDCCEPWHGGTWQYTDNEITVEEWKTEK